MDREVSGSTVDPGQSRGSGVMRQGKHAIGEKGKLSTTIRAKKENGREQEDRVRDARHAVKRASWSRRQKGRWEMARLYTRATEAGGWRRSKYEDGGDCGWGGYFYHGGIYVGGGGILCSRANVREHVTCRRADWTEWPSGRRSRQAARAVWTHEAFDDGSRC